MAALAVAALAMAGRGDGRRSRRELAVAAGMEMAADLGGGAPARKPLGAGSAALADLGGDGLGDLEHGGSRAANTDLVLEVEPRAPMHLLLRRRRKPTAYPSLAPPLQANRRRWLLL
jgi:hypothetical protein